MVHGIRHSENAWRSHSPPRRALPWPVKLVHTCAERIADGKVDHLGDLPAVADQGNLDLGFPIPLAHRRLIEIHRKKGLEDNLNLELLR
ncbi:hypothetical protein [Tateyamaria pelophila]|uniref:hypothetical protein n=1 Tax=Tateyamaria pelophila TaxID=328415 RepID=UPI0037DA2FD7